MNNNEVILQELKEKHDAAVTARRIIGFALQGMSPSVEVASATYKRFEASIPVEPNALLVLGVLSKLAQGVLISKQSASEALEASNTLVQSTTRLLAQYTDNI